MGIAHKTMSIATLVTLGLVLQGCVGQPTDPNPDAASPAPSTSPTPSVTASGSGADLAVMPFSIDCADLVPADALYEFNPNVGVDPTPNSTGLVATIADAGGVTCGWLYQSSGDRISVGVLKLEAASLERVRAEAAGRGEPETQYYTGYFRDESGIGHAEAFEGSYWIVIDSPAFLGADEAGSFLAALTPALR